MSALAYQQLIYFICGSEKQLLCMARAILKRSKVLVMDEVGHTIYDRANNR
jgi:ABC-type multidrug transport system fused ATPase/permease subunit